MSPYDQRTIGRELHEREDSMDDDRGPNLGTFQLMPKGTPVTDIVERLRNTAESDVFWLRREAAIEIERLRQREAWALELVSLDAGEYPHAGERADELRRLLGLEGDTP